MGENLKTVGAGDRNERYAGLMALEKLGAEIAIDGGYVIAKAPGGLKGAEIDFPKVTVSGTHVALMAATLANGTTVITNAACAIASVILRDTRKRAFLRMRFGVFWNLS